MKPQFTLPEVIVHRKDGRWEIRGLTRTGVVRVLLRIQMLLAQGRDEAFLTKHAHRFVAVTKDKDAKNLLFSIRIHHSSGPIWAVTLVSPQPLPDFFMGQDGNYTNAMSICFYKVLTAADFRTIEFQDFESWSKSDD